MADDRITEHVHIRSSGGPLSDEERAQVLRSVAPRHVGAPPTLSGALSVLAAQVAAAQRDASDPPRVLELLAVARATLAQVLAQAVAQGRREGVTDHQIGELLGMDQAAVGRLYPSPESGGA